MKSFDEVTKALSICGRHPDCIGCPYENVSYPTEIGNTCKDIMHYDALYYMQDRIDNYQEANPPLTWEELKQMVGKPVWVEDSNQQGEWVLLSGMEDDVLYFVYRTCNEYKIYRKEQGTLWKAYRKERS